MIQKANFRFLICIYAFSLLNFFSPPSFSLSSLSLFPLFLYLSCLCICLCVSLPVSPFFLSLLLTSLIPLPPPSSTSLSTYLHVSLLSLSLPLPQGLTMSGKYSLLFSPDQAPVTDFSVSPINFSDLVQVLGTGKCGPSHFPLHLWDGSECLGPFCFSLGFQISSLVSVKQAVGYWKGL